LYCRSQRVPCTWINVSIPTPQSNIQGPGGLDIVVIPEIVLQKFQAIVVISDKAKVDGKKYGTMPDEDMQAGIADEF